MSPLRKLIIKKSEMWYYKNQKININNDKERLLRKQARDKYRNLSEQEKNKKREYG